MLKKKIVGFILFLFVLNCFAQEPEGWYNGKPVLEIKFKGLQNIEASELDEIFKSYKKKTFSDDLYWEILQKIYALDYFTDIVPKAIPADEKYNSVFLEFIVKEKPAVKDIVFIGNSNIKKSDLLSAINIKKGDIFNEINVKNAERALKDFYIEKGFTKAEIASNTSEDKEKNSIKVEFSVKEGKVSVINKILFEGNSKFPEKALKKVLVSKEAWLLQKGLFREDALQADKSAIKLFYGEHGYIDAHVETIKRDIDSTSDPQKDQITLTYVIMEGEQFTYAGIDFQGNYIFSSEELGEKFKLKKGDIFNLKKFEIGFGDVANLYYENGYTGNYIDKKENRNTSTKEVSYTVLIIERERSHIENIIIKGNTKTKDKVILRELLLKEGDVFSKTKIMNSFRNLANLRYFSTVLPDVLPGSEPDLVDVIINVEEQSTAGIQFGITFSGVSDTNAFPMSVFAQWEEKNLFGTGRELSVNLNAASDTQSLTLGFTENWFLGKPISVGFDFSVAHKTLNTYQDLMYPFNNIPDPHLTMDEFNANPSLSDAFKMKYDRLEFGFGMNSGYRWFPKFAVITLRGGVNFGIVKNFYNSKLYRPAEERIRTQQDKWSLSNSLKIKLSIDDRDLAHDPSKGWFFSQELSFFGLMPKIEDEYFFQSDTKGEFYVTLLDYPVSEIWNLKFVLGFYSGFSFQVPLEKKPIGFDRLLYIDGAFKGRGWMGMGPQAAGMVMQNNWIEFRWPLAHGILSFDFFFDAIAVKNSLKDLRSLSINDYYFSFGPGLRFSIPQFPLRLLFANTFRSENGKPVWGNGKGADWRFVLSFNIPNL
ncbi:outer membrane protein assembly factor BamA [Treponema sp. OMZ 787]|uniref:outer membrane protein assembly factor BamA n=1 Tax=Treponema sp. OMZ 787 TaxID=2563669 RepID=UPI0020A5E146|nr:outer membrane protein assembly factor BamA [Treponema sp. OMZ 787]UTC62216.1 outer membrane protein assembly factor BamA [Treponema sp. OMZ 787]